MAAPKQQFTFAFFDAARTEGYVDASDEGKGARCRGSPQSTAHGDFFADDEQDEDIVEKIQHWQRSNQDGKPKRTPKSSKLSGLASKRGMQATPLKSYNNAPPATNEDIQLSRLLDNYMLGATGDVIMKRMEELTTDAPLSPAEAPSSKQIKVKDPGAHEKSDDVEDDADTSSDLAALVSMADFEKYIANN